MFTIQNTKDDGGWAVAIAMLPPLPTKPTTLPWHRGFIGGGKKRRVRKATYEWETSELWEDRAYDCGYNSGSHLSGCWFFKKKNSSSFETVYYLNQDNPVSSCPKSYASMHARRPTMQWACGTGQFIYNDYSHLLRHTQGQTLAEFWSPSLRGHNSE